MNEPYRVPDETYRLLWKWGESKFYGLPRLGYPGKATACGEYLSPRVKDDEGKPDLTEFECLCGIIDHNLNRHETEALKCHFRYKHDGRPWSKRRSAQHMGITVTEYNRTYNKALRIIDRNLNGEEAA